MTWAFEKGYGRKHMGERPEAKLYCLARREQNIAFGVPEREAKK